MNHSTAIQNGSSRWVSNRLFFVFEFADLCDEIKNNCEITIINSWNDYARIGKQIHGTRFVAFKVPLREVRYIQSVNQNETEISGKNKFFFFSQQTKGVKCLKINSKIYFVFANFFSSNSKSKTINSNFFLLFLKDFIQNYC